jgi:protein-disulfide isomerase
MAVPPRFAATRLVFGSPVSAHASVPPARHTLEFFLDYCCPYSAKIFKTITGTIAPLIRDNAAWAPAVELVFRQQIQPWHPSSTLMHEAALAVLATSPERFWDFSAALFAQQRDYFDVAVVNETRNQTYGRLARLAASVGADEARVLDQLRIPETAAEGGDLNVGNKVTASCKIFTKMHRLVGVHVTPTVIFDGVVRGEIGSAWTADQWKQFLEENV